MRLLRLLRVTWWLQLKLRSRSAFDGILALLWPIFFATTIYFMYGGASAAASPALLSAAMGASVMGVWTAVSTTAAAALQRERRMGTLELLVAAPTPFAVSIFPITLSMATIGAYSIVTTLLWGKLVFGIDLAVRQPVVFLLATLLTVVSTATLGYLLAICSVRYRTAWALGAALELPVWLICGFLVPLSLFPDWVRPIAWLLAPTWGMSAIRAAAEGRNALADIAICLGLTVAYVAAGSVLARILVNSARSRATLALT